MDIDNVRLAPKWSKTKEEIWAGSFEALPDRSQRPIFRYIAGWSAAAVLLILVSSGAFMALYTKSFVSPNGQHLTLSLPDGSLATLNADSRISYKPYMWKFSRSLDMEGEAFFEVRKGKVFTVRTKSADISVLGTSFNVYARNEELEVACVTGKVKVSSGDQQTILMPERQCSFDAERKLVVRENKEIMEEISWKDGKFIFYNTPLDRVLDEVERQYDIKIKRPAGKDYFYTGSFSMDRDVREVLEIIGTPFAMKFVVNE